MFQQNSGKCSLSTKVFMTYTSDQDEITQIGYALPHETTKIKEKKYVKQWFSRNWTDKIKDNDPRKK